MNPARNEADVRLGHCSDDAVGLKQQCSNVIHENDQAVESKQVSSYTQQQHTNTAWWLGS